MEAKSQVMDTLKSLNYIRSLENQELPFAPKVNLLKIKQKLLVLDMDETLAHCIPDEDLEYNDNGEVITPYDAKLVMKSDGELEDMYVNIRPFLKKLISDLKSLFQIVVLTASTSDYADSILDYLDPHYSLFEARFYRENCVKTAEGVYLKDL